MKLYRIKQTATLLIMVLIAFSVQAQSKATISGTISDSRTGESLIGATVYDKTTGLGTASNQYGFYSLSLTSGKQELVYAYLGYKSQALNLNTETNIKKNISLESAEIGLEEITIKATGTKHRTNEFSVDKITIQTIAQLPSPFGEADVIKAVQLQSGVKTMGEGSSGMFIRGGSSDQNLILIDEAPIYNPAHMFGLISVFNPDALNHVSLYKSNMPAQYGGRVSGVLDCKMKEGNMNDYDFSIGLSPFSSSLSANGPIVKERASFFVSARRSLFDLFLKPGMLMEFMPSYNDLNLKTNTKLGKNNRIYLSIYHGKDRLQSADSFFNNWGNSSATLRWNSNIGSKWFVNTSAIYSNYQNYMEYTDQTKQYRWQTGVTDLNLKTDISYYIAPENSVKFGAGSVYHRFIPGETADSNQSIARVQAFEHTFYILNDIKPTPWLGLNYGLRLSVFQNVGKANWYEQNGYNYTENTNTKGIYQSYAKLEPRTSANFMLHPNYSIKLAYARNAQYMQVLQNNSLAYSTLETWFPASPNVKPIIVDAVSLGWFQSINASYSLSVEAYYKSYQNQIDYVDHAQLLNNPYVVFETRQGTAQAYGAEFLLKKDHGKLTGSMSYTYARAQRTIASINEGEEYSSPYDMPHDIRLNGNYKISKRWNLSAAWVYTTGRPVTLPIGFFFEEREPVPIYSKRNGNRFPDYHRMDMSFNYTNKQSSKKTYWNLSFGAFNTYAHANPMGYEFTRKFGGNNIVVSEYSFIRFLPNFSVKFNF